MADGSVVAPDVLVLFRVDLSPETPRGAAPRFSEYPPPVLVDSAARESLATGPEGSFMRSSALGSVVTYV